MGKLAYQNGFGELTIDLQTLHVTSTIDWAAIWKESEYDIEVFTDHIHAIFDTLYEKYGIEHDFEPTTYQEKLGDFSVTLSDQQHDFLLTISLKNNIATLIEQQTIYSHLS